jgi:hypothetical protein
MGWISPCSQILWASSWRGGLRESLSRLVGIGIDGVQRGEPGDSFLVDDRFGVMDSSSWLLGIARHSQA